MEHFLDTVDTIPEGLGFSHYSPIHLVWLAGWILFAVVSCLLYRRLDKNGRARMRKVYAFATVADEGFKVIMLLLGGNYDLAYLPLHLCSINIFLIAYHAYRPGKILGNFLYLVSIPGAAAAMLFPTWTALPPANFMHIHSFTVHCLLSVYPLMCFWGGDIQPKLRYLPRCLALLLAMALPIWLFNRRFGTNFMFLMYAEPGNPLYWFEQHWGNHLLGLPVLLAAVVVILFLPLSVSKRIRKKIAAKV